MDGTVGPGTAIGWLWVSTELSNSTTCQNAGPEKFLRIATIFSNNPKTGILKWRGSRGNPNSAMCPAHLLGGYRRLGISRRGR